MIYKETAQKTEIALNLKEVLRYLGYKEKMADTETEDLILKIYNETGSEINLSACFTMCDISLEGETINFEGFSVCSKSLSKNLMNCEKCVIFCATAGSGVDRIISKYSRISPARAVIAQAVGTSIIEEWCNLLCKRIESKLKSDKLYLRPRFSAGYGDFSLEHQRDIFNLLTPSKHIGVSLTESLMMTPSKSVSGIIGISKENKNCTPSGCESCKMRKVCEYSRG